MNYPTIEQKRDSLAICRKILGKKQEERQAVFVEYQAALAALRSVKAEFEAGDLKLAPKVADAQAVFNAYNDALNKADRELVEAAKRVEDAQAEIVRAEKFHDPNLMTDLEIQALVAEAIGAIDAILFPLADKLEAHAEAFRVLEAVVSNTDRASWAALGVGMPHGGAVTVSTDEGTRLYEFRGPGTFLKDATYDVYGRWSRNGN